MSNDIKMQVVEQMKNSRFPYFALALDETTDVASCAQLIGYVRYVLNDTVKEEFLFCRELKATTTAKDIFDEVDRFFREEGLPWEMLLAVCTDGAPAMIGAQSGFKALVQKKCPEVIWTHCAIHRQVLVAKTLPPELKEVMAVVVKAVNFIRGRAVNHRIFRELCSEIGSEFQALLFHTEIRWLSKGRTLNRFLALREEIMHFLEEKQQSDLANMIGDDCFMAKVCYLADIFSELNNLNLSLQGDNKCSIDLYEKLCAFHGKIILWKRRVSNENLVMFNKLNNILREKNVNCTFKDGILSHLTAMDTALEKYFQEDLDPSHYAWIRQPFMVPCSCIEDADPAKECFLELRSDSTLRVQFQEMILTNFWIAMLPEYPVLANRALRQLLPFTTTYRCEAGFSSLLVAKTKQRNRLCVENDLRCALSNTSPRITDLVAKMQSQPSH